MNPLYLAAQLAADRQQTLQDQAAHARLAREARRTAPRPVGAGRPAGARPVRRSGLRRLIAGLASR